MGSTNFATSPTFSNSTQSHNMTTTYDSDFWLQCQTLSDIGDDFPELDMHAEESQPPTSHNVGEERSGNSQEGLASSFQNNYSPPSAFFLDTLINQAYLTPTGAHDVREYYCEPCREPAANTGIEMKLGKCNIDLTGRECAQELGVAEQVIENQASDQQNIASAFADGSSLSDLPPVNHGVVPAFTYATVLEGKEEEKTLAEVLGNRGVKPRGSRQKKVYLMLLLLEQRGWVRELSFEGGTLQRVEFEKSFFERARQLLNSCVKCKKKEPRSAGGLRENLRSFLLYLKISPRGKRGGVGNYGDWCESCVWERESA